MGRRLLKLRFYSLEPVRCHGSITDNDKCYQNPADSEAALAVGASVQRTKFSGMLTGVSILIRTGADVCVCPGNKVQDQRKKDTDQLYAANTHLFPPMAPASIPSISVFEELSPGNSSGQTSNSRTFSTTTLIFDSAPDKHPA